MYFTRIDNALAAAAAAAAALGGSACVALAHIRGVREAERVLSATDSFAVLKLVPQQTDNAMVRRAFRRIALDIHPDKACDQHDTACIRAVGAAVVAAAVARDELLDINAQLQLLTTAAASAPAAMAADLHCDRVGCLCFVIRVHHANAALASAVPPACTEGARIAEWTSQQ